MGNKTSTSTSKSKDEELEKEQKVAEQPSGPPGGHLPAPLRVMEDCWGYHRTMLVHTMQKLKIPDFIGDGTKTVAEIAKYTETEIVENVERLMYALAAIGYFDLKEEMVFANNELSSILRRDHPLSLAGNFGHNVDDCWTAWGKIPEMFGKDPIACPWDEAFPQYAAGKGKGGFFGPGGYMQSNPDQEEQFMRAMQSLEGLGGEAMADGGPFQNFKRIVDVGGSRGHFTIRLLNKYPELTGLVMDRAPVIELAEQANGDDEDVKKLGDRLSYFGGDFFDKEKMPEIQDGDVLLLRFILHDWSDADSLKILKVMRACIGDKKATLLIGETAMPNRDRLGFPPTVHNVDMQMMVIFGTAKERTPKQWQVLLKDAGFAMGQIHPTKSLLHWVEGSPQ